VIEYCLSRLLAAIDHPPDRFDNYLIVPDGPKVFALSGGIELPIAACS
jgi:hypothetical protein